MTALQRNGWNRIALVIGVLVAVGMLVMPPWRDLEVPPFGSSEHFAGYSPIFHPPHDPWTLPLLADRAFWNAQHDYRWNWTVLAVQETVILVMTVAAAAVLSRCFASHLSIPGAVLGGLWTAVIGFIGVIAIMPALLQVAPQARVLTTSFLLAVYLTAIAMGTVIGARLRLASLVWLIVGLGAGQVVVAYTAFALLPDDSPGAHRILLVVWLVATMVGAATGLWASAERKRLHGECDS